MDPTRDHATTAYQVADTVRTLNTLTDKPQAFAAAADVRDVLEGVHLAVDQLPQTVRQLSAGLRLLEEQGVLHVEGVDACEAASGALRGLLNAEVGLTVARAALREVAGALAGMSERPADGGGVR